MAGKPEYWTTELKKKAVEIILNKISVEKLSLRKALENRDTKVLPAPVTFLEWISQDEQLAKQYAYACEERADAIFDEMFDIADESSKDTYIKDGNLITNNEVIQRSRLRVDTRKWALSKMNPKKYGDASKITLEGNLDIKTKTDYSSYSTEDLKAIEEITKKYDKKDS